MFCSRAGRVLPILIAPLLLLAFGCSDSERTYTWDLQSHATADSVDFIELVKMTDSIRLMSNGRLDINALSAGSITGGPDIYNAVKERRVEMGSGWPNWWSGQHPAWAVMNAGAFEFMNIDASLLFFMAGEGTAIANELSAPDGILWRPAWWAGMEFGLLSREEVTGLSDLEGKKIRIGPGLPSEVLAAATGAFAIPLVPDEIRPALASGDLDAVEWTTPSGAWNLGLNDIVSYGIVPAIWQPAVFADFLINQEAYDELTEDLQAILETAIRSYTLTTTAIAKVEDFGALERFLQDGLILDTWPEDDIVIWRTVSQEIIQAYSEQDSFTRRLMEAKTAFKESYDGYYEYFGPYE